MARLRKSAAFDSDIDIATSIQRLQADNDPDERLDLYRRFWQHHARNDTATASSVSPFPSASLLDEHLPVDLHDALESTAGLQVQHRRHKAQIHALTDPLRCPWYNEEMNRGGFTLLRVYAVFGDAISSYTFLSGLRDLANIPGLTFAEGTRRIYEKADGRPLQPRHVREVIEDLEQEGLTVVGDRKMAKSWKGAHQQSNSTADSAKRSKRKSHSMDTSTEFDEGGSKDMTMCTGRSVETGRRHVNPHQDAYDDPSSLQTIDESSQTQDMDELSRANDAEKRTARDNLEASDSAKQNGDSTTTSLCVTGGGADGISDDDADNDTGAANDTPNDDSDENTVDPVNDLPEDDFSGADPPGPWDDSDSPNFDPADVDGESSELGCEASRNADADSDPPSLRSHSNSPNITLRKHPRQLGSNNTHETSFHPTALSSHHLVSDTFDNTIMTKRTAATACDTDCDMQPLKRLCQDGQAGADDDVPDAIKADNHRFLSLFAVCLAPWVLQVDDSDTTISFRAKNAAGEEVLVLCLAFPTHHCWALVHMLDSSDSTLHVYLPDASNVTADEIAARVKEETTETESLFQQVQEHTMPGLTTPSADTASQRLFNMNTAVGASACALFTLLEQDYPTSIDTSLWSDALLRCYELQREASPESPSSAVAQSQSVSKDEKSEILAGRSNKYSAFQSTSEGLLAEIAGDFDIAKRHQAIPGKLYRLHEGLTSAVEQCEAKTSATVDNEEIKWLEASLINESIPKAIRQRNKEMLEDKRAAIGQQQAPADVWRKLAQAINFKRIQALDLGDKAKRDAKRDRDALVSIMQKLLVNLRELKI
ncbi:Hypothetical predicted protein [Lecanosticta acicola]|uniref:Uncharacterized protein n=1 Tax=Lecanosticta acicola TaxID=111012 RepID=A0AAI8Z984_9PEZI|nr:Hypothetical predicted protein [Lecanosticta acicola]